MQQKRLTSPLMLPNSETIRFQDSSQFQRFRDFILDFKGLDLELYQDSSCMRRLEHAMERLKVNDLGQLELLLARRPELYEEFIAAFTVGVSSLFRDPDSLRFFREFVLPLVLNKNDHPGILITGQSSGEELASILITLEELNLRQSFKILATDLSQTALNRALKPKVNRTAMTKASRDYISAGGVHRLDYYFQASSLQHHLHPDLCTGVKHALFDLSKDELEQSFDIIFCRNVLIYFKPAVQGQIIARLHRHLKSGGFLILGEKESIIFYPPHKNDFVQIGGDLAIYRKI